MNEFAIQVFNGIIAILSVSVAVLAILINNLRATARQKTERKIGFKMQLIEDIYCKYKDVSENYLEEIASVESKLYKIHEEIVSFGTDNECQKYILELYELSKKAVFLAIYKRKIIEVLDIKINADDLARFISDTIKTISVYSNMISYVSKLYVVKYYTYHDIHKAAADVLDELKREKESLNKLKNTQDIFDDYISFMDETKQQSINGFDSILGSLNEKDKRIISKQIGHIIGEYSKDINSRSLELLDRFEEQVADSLKKLNI